jgi:glycosyltransferase involved in cell wall biosynthesis
MRTLYIGDFIKYNGPSLVDIRLNDVFPENVEKEQINKVFNMNFFFKIIKADIIHVSGVSIKGVIALFLAKLMFKKTTFTMHGALKIEKKFKKISLLRILMEKIQIDLSNKIITVSEMYKNKIIKFYDNISHQKINCIYNGINKNNFYKYKNQKKENQILTIGGGRPEKGVKYICQAIESINNKRIKLIVVGEDGEDTQKIKEYSFVEYKGFLSQEKLFDLMKESKIFIQNSIYESFGLTVFEALSYGCELILSNNIGALEILDIKDKYIVNYRDKDRIKHLILSLLNSKTNRQKTNINYDKYSWPEISQNYLEMWENL